MQLLCNTFSLLSILLLICTPVHVFAAPRSASDKINSQFATPQYHEHSVEPSRGFLRWLPQLTWLRNTGINNFLRKPFPSRIKNERPTALPSTGKLPTKLLAHYGRDVVLRFNISTPYEEQMLADAADHLMLDVWEFTGNWVDIRLGEDVVSSLLDWLPESLQKSYTRLMVDLVKTIYQQYPSSETHTMFTPSLKAHDDDADGMFFSEYQPLSVIHPWMRLLAAMFTTHVRMINIGTSYEGRDILGLRVGVSSHLSQESSSLRKTIIISGGLHAREWISVSTVTYIAWSLINSYGKSPGITKLLQEFDFVFIPTINPDGYVYTWENDRLWRKNRQKTNIKFCQGLDLDRGFGFEWEGNSADANPCSESYPGEQPFQAMEAYRLAEWAKNETENNGVNFVGFLDFHSYSQQVLYPYSYSCNADPPSLENLEELGMGLAKAIRISSGEQYGVASACEGAVSSKLGGGYSRLETGGGSAIDWFYHEMKVRYSYQIKLRDTGSYGFLLPKENIIPTGDEAFNAVKYFGDFLLGNKGIESNLLHELHHGPLVASAKQIYPEPVDEEEAMYETEEVNWELRRRRRR